MTAAFRRALVGLLAMTATLPAQADQPGAPLAAWIAFGSGGKAELRAVVAQGRSCPTAHASTGAIPLAPTSAPDDAFPVIACAADLPNGAASIKIDGIGLKAPKARIDRIVVLGDSGCRLKGIMTAQACNDPAAWPFAAIARNAAAEAPDLVIHLGDYHYREVPCPDGNAGCAGSPWGDTWATWNADFFTPAQPLLAAAPWVMVRGNHEDCTRAGHGWTLLLSPDGTRAAPPTAQPTAQTACLPAHRPYGVDLGGLTLAVIDDNDASEIGVEAAVEPRLLADIRATAPADRPWWLLTHHPAHGVVRVTPLGAIGSNPALGMALAAAPQPQLLLSGHIHTFMVENFTDNHPPQLVVGTGGDSLEKTRYDDLAGVASGDWTIQDGFGLPDFGYAVMERAGTDWRIVGHFPDGRIARRCLLHQGRIDCSH
jgi:hypothetical protein